MSVRIRLARIGKKKAPFYRIVAVDSRTKRDGKFLENLGTFNPISGEMVQYHADRIQAWIEKGALPTESVVKLQKRHKKGLVGAVNRDELLAKQQAEAAQAKIKAEAEAKAEAEKAAQEAAEAEKAKKAAAKEEAPATEAVAEEGKAESKE